LTSVGECIAYDDGGQEGDAAVLFEHEGGRFDIVPRQVSRGGRH
jgi:hypothetical protein